MKVYKDNFKLELVRSKIFQGLTYLPQLNIFKVINLSSGTNLPKNDMIEGQYIVYGGGGITSKTHNEYNVTTETLGIGRVGARCGCVFKVLPNSWVTDNALFATEVSQEYDLSFLIHYLDWSNLNRFAQQSAQPVISQRGISNVDIPIIDKSEQIKISKLLDGVQFSELDKKLLEDFGVLKTIEFEELWTSLNDLISSIIVGENSVSSLRQSILTEAVQGHLTTQWRQDNPNQEHARELLQRIAAEKAQLIKDKKIGKEKPLPEITEEEVPFVVPEGWVWCRLQDLVDVGTGSTPSKANLAFYSGNISWYTSSATGDLFAKPPDQFISELALRETNCKVFPAGSLIIAMYGQGKTRGQVSELVIPGATNQALAAMVFFETSVPIKHYVKYYFRKIYHEIRELAEGGAQPNLNVLKIKSTLIPLPPLPEQHAIVQKVNTLMAYCDELEQQIQQSKADLDLLMQAVLGEVFGGHISTKD